MAKIQGYGDGADGAAQKNWPGVGPEELAGAAEINWSDGPGVAGAKRPPGQTTDPGDTAKRFLIYFHQDNQ